MALITCKDCNKEFSTDAPHCVHCGADKPQMFLHKLGWYFGAVVGVLMMIGVLSGGESSRPPQTIHANSIEATADTKIIDDFPKYDVEAECHEEGLRYVNGNGGCLMREQQYYNKLKYEWYTASELAKKNCVNGVNKIPYEKYVELELCINASEIIDAQRSRQKELFEQLRNPSQFQP